jgi:hypothetical protein
MSNSRMRAPALAGVATVRGARGAPGPTLIRARGTMNEPTSMPAPLAILAEVSSDAGRDLRGGQLSYIDVDIPPRAFDGVARAEDRSRDEDRSDEPGGGEQERVPLPGSIPPTARPKDGRYSGGADSPTGTVAALSLMGAALSSV